jgi:CBS domain-containing protein
MARAARDVMQTYLISVNPETPLLEVHRLFVDEEINGAPVVDETGRLLGVISSVDLLRAVEEEHDAASSGSSYFRDFLELSGPDWQEGPDNFQARLGERTVSDAMTRGGITVAPDTLISDVAASLRKHRIHRVFVVDGEQLCGVISTFDLVALLEKA